MDVATRPTAKHSRVDPKLFVVPGKASAMDIRRGIIIRELVARWEDVSPPLVIPFRPWTARSEARPWAARFEALVSSSPTPSSSRMVYEIEVLPRRYSSYAPSRIRALLRMIELSEKPRNNGSAWGPVLRVVDGFYLTARPGDFFQSMGSSSKVEPGPESERWWGVDAMLIAAQIPADAKPLVDSLNRDNVADQIVAIVATLSLAWRRHRMLMLHVDPSAVMTVPVPPEYTYVRIGDHTFSADALSRRLPQLFFDRSYWVLSDSVADVSRRRMGSGGGRLDGLRDATGGYSAVPWLLNRVTSGQGRCLLSLACALIRVIAVRADGSPDTDDGIGVLRGDEVPGTDVIQRLVALMPTEAQLLDLAEAVAPRAPAMVPLQQYMTALVRLRRAVERPIPGWSRNVFAALDNIRPSLNDEVFPLAAPFMPSFSGVLEAFGAPPPPDSGATLVM